MIFWLVIAVMTAAALALVLTPLILRQRRSPPRVEFDLTIYRDQLEELERDRARGLIGEDQGEAAHLEIQRRMLAAAKRGSGEPPPLEFEDGTETAPSGKGRPWLLMVGIGAAIPASAVVLYLVLGSPGMPGRPFSGMAQSGGGMAGEIMAGENMAGQSVEAAIANLADRLEKEPDNREGWFLLGRSLMALERHAEAVQALRTAAALSNGDPDILVSMAEAMVFAAQGMVTPNALATFQTVLAALPDDAAAQYYIGMALAQQGRSDEALGMWRKLAAETPADAPWRQDLVTLMRRAAEESGVELGAIPAAPGAPAASVAPGPSREDMAAAAEMSPEARMEMIRSMVARLAARLAEEPDDLEGWRRLANAYRVLGEDAKAAAADKRIDELSVATVQPAETAPGPSAEEMAAAGDMSVGDRTQMIDAMVARLAERLRENPDDLTGWLRLGRSYSVLGRHEEALDAFAQAGILAPGDTAVLGAHARAVMNAAGEATQFPEQAIALYRRIVALDPEQHEALWFLGFAEAASGQDDGARDYWNRLLELLPAAGPDREAVEQALDGLQD